MYVACAAVPLVMADLTRHVLQGVDLGFLIYLLAWVGFLEPALLCSWLGRSSPAPCGVCGLVLVMRPLRSVCFGAVSRMSVYCSTCSCYKKAL